MDQVWFSIEHNDIVLALQHEVWERKVPQLFELLGQKNRKKNRFPQEVRQLIDVKALRKVLIAYPTKSDNPLKSGKQVLFEQVTNWLAAQRLRFCPPLDVQYMIIVGLPLSNIHKREFVFEGRILDDYGATIEELPTRRLVQQ